VHIIKTAVTGRPAKSLKALEVFKAVQVVLNYSRILNDKTYLNAYLTTKPAPFWAE
jgi:hypothetical protein